MTQPAEQDIFAVLDSDHQALLALVDDATTAVDPNARSVACEQLVMELVRHFVAEEQYLLPLYDKHLPDGAELASTARAEHRRVEDELRRLEELESSAEAVGPVLADVAAALRAHIARQAAPFQALAQDLDPQVLIELGGEVRGAEQLAPTRPRLLHPESTSVNKALSLLRGYVDRARDAFSQRGV